MVRGVLEFNSCWSSLVNLSDHPKPIFPDRVCNSLVCHSISVTSPLQKSFLMQPQGMRHLSFYLFPSHHSGVQVKQWFTCTSFQLSALHFVFMVLSPLSGETKYRLGNGYSEHNCSVCNGDPEFLILHLLHSELRLWPLITFLWNQK